MKGVNKYIKALSCLIFLCCLASCKKTEFTDIKEYYKYLADPANGLVKEKTVAGIKFKIKYLPEDYLAYNVIKEMSHVTAGYKDSVLKAYDHSVTYIINIGPADKEEFDVTRVGIDNYEEFAQRIEEMAFNARDWISAEVAGKGYKPALVELENINALEKSRNFIVVFNSEKNSKNDFRNNDMCISYSDELFNTGVNKFIFNSKDIQRLPRFKF